MHIFPFSHVGDVALGRDEGEWRRWLGLVLERRRGDAPAGLRSWRSGLSDNDASSAQACWDRGSDDEHIVQEAWNASAVLGRVFFWVGDRRCSVSRAGDGASSGPQRQRGPVG